MHILIFLQSSKHNTRVYINHFGKSFYALLSKNPRLYVLKICSPRDESLPCEFICFSF